jgi:hypothetical protein
VNYGDGASPYLSATVLVAGVMAPAMLKLARLPHIARFGASHLSIAQGVLIFLPVRFQEKSYA